jgi:hypothetical protein
MQIFLNHAQRDGSLARELADRLAKVGLTIWRPEAEIFPGDNWAKKIGKALEESEGMVVLLTPRAADSDWFRENIQFALGSKKFANRVFTVFVGPTLQAGRDVPWILLKLPDAFEQVESAKDFGLVAKKIRRHFDLSPVHA